MHTAADAITAALSGVLIVLLAIIGVRAWLRARVSPAEKERRRRLWLTAAGKITDANLRDIHADLLVYSYAVRGVDYTASQDISALQAFLPPDVASLGPVLVKYDSRNPANSMVLAEDWSGLHSTSPSSARPAPPLSPGK